MEASMRERGDPKRSKLPPAPWLAQRHEKAARKLEMERGCSAIRHPGMA